MSPPDTEQLAAALRLALDGQRGDKPSAATLPRIVPLGDTGWMDAPPPERAALLRTRGGKLWLGRGHPASLVGAGGTGKTRALTQLAVAVATGTEWIGSIMPERAGRVLLLLGEEDAAEANRRIQYAAEVAEGAAAYDLRQNLYPVALRGRNCALVDDDDNDSEFFRSLLDFMRSTDGEWDLVIMDPAARFMGPDSEMDPHSGTRWVECLERMCEVPGNPTVLVGQHTNKSQGLAAMVTNQGAARGTSAITDAMRWQANLEKVANGKGADAVIDELRIRLRVVKTNYTAPSDPIELRRDEHGRLVLMTDADIIAAANDHLHEQGAELRERVLDALAAGPMSTSALREALNVRRQSLTESLRVLEKQEHIRRDGTGPRQVWTSNSTQPTLGGGT